MSLNEVHDTANRAEKVVNWIYWFISGALSVILGLGLAAFFGVILFLSKDLSDQVGWLLWGIALLFGFGALSLAWWGFRVLVFILRPTAQAPKQSDALGRARTATMDDLRRKGIIK